MPGNYSRHSKRISVRKAFPPHSHYIHIILSERTRHGLHGAGQCACFTGQFLNSINDFIGSERHLSGHAALYHQRTFGAGTRAEAFFSVRNMANRDPPVIGLPHDSVRGLQHQSHTLRHDRPGVPGGCKIPTQTHISEQRKTARSMSGPSAFELGAWTNRTARRGANRSRNRSGSCPAARRRR